MTVCWVRDLSADLGAIVSPVKMRPATSEHQVGPCVPTINQDLGLIQARISGGRAENMRENVFCFLGVFFVAESGIKNDNFWRRRVCNRRC